MPYPDWQVGLAVAVGILGPLAIAGLVTLLVALDDDPDDVQHDAECCS